MKHLLKHGTVSRVRVISVSLLQSNQLVKQQSVWSVGKRR